MEEEGDEEEEDETSCGEGKPLGDFFPDTATAAAAAAAAAATLLLHVLPLTQQVLI